MNAALMAACAANAIRHNQSLSSPYCRGEELYYDISIRKYFYFNALTIVTPVREFYVGPYFNSERHLELKPVSLPAKTVAVEYRFSVKASECNDNVDSYIESNLASIEGRAGWQETELSIVNDYAEEIRNKYQVTVLPGSLLYTSEVCWEVS